MTIPDNIREEIEKAANEACLRHCGHDGTYSCHVCEGKHKELYIKAATQFFERALYDLMKHIKEKAYNKQRRLEDYGFTIFELQEYIDEYKKLVGE